MQRACTNGTSAGSASLRRDHFKRLFSFGFALSPWQTANYTEYKSIGKFEGDTFDPRKWQPQTLDRCLPRDARRRCVLGGAARGGVHRRHDPRFGAAGEFSDPQAEQYLVDVLIKRGKRSHESICPRSIPSCPRLDGNGGLTFANAAVDAGVAKAPASYRAAWSSFDNATNESKPIAETTSATAAMQAPAGLPTMPGSFVAIEVAPTKPPTRRGQAAESRSLPTRWRTWKLVGLERVPENVPTNPKTARR